LMSNKSTDQSVRQRMSVLPSVSDVLAAASALRLADEAGTQTLARLAREAIDALRRELDRLDGVSRAELIEMATERMSAEWRLERRRGIRRVINATGVVIHTNLGRAPLSVAAREAILEAAGYSTVEYDLEAGGRGGRGRRAEELLSEAAGAEACLVVNNCAAAALLVLTVFAKGRETVVSRGELVEIGGDFRIPDVLEASGSRLREVGTTNRTRIADYERAIGDETAVILRVHPSNYRIVGFTEKPELKDLTEAAHRRGLIVYEDAGSGALSRGLADETVIRESIAAGADIVTFSGDKLLGGPQAGIIAGRLELIERMRRHPLYRALRADKIALAALEATVGHYLRAEEEREIPVQRAIALTQNRIAERAREIARRLEKIGGIEVSVDEGISAVGGGASPGVGMPTMLLSVLHAEISARRIEQMLRDGEPPVIARIEDGKVLIDLRTVAENEDDEVFAALRAIR
jgi:L-seryl-tRNA(Ser) seleniumtransferase